MLSAVPEFLWVFEAVLREAGTKRVIMKQYNPFRVMRTR